MTQQLFPQKQVSMTQLFVTCLFSCLSKTSFVMSFSPESLFTKSSDKWGRELTCIASIPKSKEQGTQLYPISCKVCVSIVFVTRSTPAPTIRSRVLLSCVLCTVRLDLLIGDFECISYGDHISYIQRYHRLSQLLHHVTIQEIISRLAQISPN